MLQNDLDDDVHSLNHDDIHLESPDSEKNNKENDLDQLADAMDIEASESCGINAISLVSFKKHFQVAQFTSYLQTNEPARAGTKSSF